MARSRQVRSVRFQKHDPSSPSDAVPSRERVTRESSSSTPTPTPFRVVLRAQALRYEVHFKNAKYVVMEMLSKRRHSRAANALINSDPMPEPASNHGIDLEFRRWRLVETGVWARDDGECSGKPRELCESLGLSKVRIELDTAELQRTKRESLLCVGSRPKRVSIATIGQCRSLADIVKALGYTPPAHEIAATTATAAKSGPTTDGASKDRAVLVDDARVYDDAYFKAELEPTHDDAAAAGKETAETTNNKRPRDDDHHDRPAQSAARA